MRTGLTPEQSMILDSDTKKCFWLFEVDQDNDGVIDYYWAQEARTWNGQAYTFKIMDFGPIATDIGLMEASVVNPSTTTIRVSFANSSIDGLYASDFEGASVTVRLVCGAILDLPSAAEEDWTDEATTETQNEQWAEIAAWRFKVLSSCSVNQIMTWQCQDWFTLYLEGDYPNTPLVSDLFRADIMKADNVCVPIVFGQPYFPIRWFVNNQTVTFIGAASFSVTGNYTTLYAAGRFVLASCGADGSRSCWVQSSSYGSGITTVTLTAASDDLTSNLTSAQTNFYLLGGSTPTYTIDRAHTPLEQGGKTTYLASAFTFNQVALIGSDGDPYKAVELLAYDIDKDGTYDANSFWHIPGKEVYDMPCRFSRSDTAAITSPPDIAEYIFEDWGIPSGEIDPISQAAAAAIFSARGVTMDVGLWYRVGRKKLIAKLFAMSGMVPLYRDTFGFKVLTKVSQLTLEDNLIQPGSFKIEPLAYQPKQKDSGYVTWQAATNPVDKVNKSLIAAKSTTSNKSEETIECDWILDSTKAQKAGKLAVQRLLLRSDKVTFRAQGKILRLEPGDMITINPANLGAEGAAYDCMITKMSISTGLWVDIECIRFSDSLDDWDDLSASDITVIEAGTDKGGSPVYQGPSMVEGGENEVTQTIRVTNGGDIELAGSDTDPGIVKFIGTVYSAQVGGDADGDRFLIKPDTTGIVDLYLGYSEAWWGDDDSRWENISAEATKYIDLFSGDFSGSVNGASIRVNGHLDETEPRITLGLHDKTAGSTQYYYFYHGSFQPSTIKGQDLGHSSNAWDDAYADDWNNVADFYFLDHRQDGKKIIPVDDIETIKAIKPSGTFDHRTGLELIDDNTLPEWLLTKDKKTGEVARDPKGKPYLSLKAVDSLLMGATRQLAEQIEELKKQISGMLLQINKLQKKGC